MIKKTSPESTISLVQARHKRMDTSSGMKKNVKTLKIEAKYASRKSYGIPLEK